MGAQTRSPAGTWLWRTADTGFGPSPARRTDGLCRRGRNCPILAGGISLKAYGKYLSSFRPPPVCLHTKRVKSDPLNSRRRHP